MRLVPLLAVLGIGCLPGSSAGPAGNGDGRGADRVRVATWNVHDLFDAEDRLFPPGDADLVLAPGEVEEKLSRVAAVLSRLDADLVVLQEVENRPLLGRLAALAGYPFARLVEGNDPRGIDVAVLSRLPLRAYASHREELDPDGRLLWPRDCVEVHAEAGARRLVAVASHFSSKLSDGGRRRTWQAARMREIADGLAEEDPSAVVLAGGDLNDAPESEALAPLLSGTAWLDPLPIGVTTWVGAGGEARLDYLLVRRDAPVRSAVAWAERGPDVALASDHRPVILDVDLQWR